MHRSLFHRGYLPMSMRHETPYSNVISRPLLVATKAKVRRSKLMLAMLGPACGRPSTSPSDYEAVQTRSPTQVSVNAIHMRTNWQCSTHVKRAALAVQRPHNVAGADSLAAAHFHDSADVLSKSKKEQVSEWLNFFVSTTLQYLRA